jgi:hypothetical protein
MLVTILQRAYPRGIDEGDDRARFNLSDLKSTNRFPVYTASRGDEAPGYTKPVRHARDNQTLAQSK